MKCFVLVILMIIFVPIVSATCEDSQININSASLEKLDEITHIDLKVAEYIIKARPFNSIDELVNVSYISEGYLEDIKEEGLACVGGEEQEIDDEPIIAEEIIEEVEEVIEKSVLVLNNNIEKRVEIISLNNKVAEEEDDLVYTSKNAQVVDYLPYGFALFLIFITGFLIWERF